MVGSKKLPGWSQKLDGSANLFLLSDDKWLKGIGWVSIVAQIIAIALVYIVLVDDPFVVQPSPPWNVTLPSYYSYGSSSPPSAPPSLPSAPPSPPGTTTTDFKHGGLAKTLATGVMIVFILAWTANDFRNIAVCFNKDRAVCMGFCMLVPLFCGIVSAGVYAYNEGDDNEDGGAYKIVIDSVTVLLILELDEKLYDAAKAFYDPKEFEKLMEFDAEGHV